jgi:hypothetical protein
VREILAAAAAPKAGDNIEIDASVAEGLHLFRGAAENQRVATLEANDDFVARGVGDQQSVDFFLGQQLPAAALTNVDDLGAARDSLQHFAADERIVKNDRGAL